MAEFGPVRKYLGFQREAPELAIRLAPRADRRGVRVAAGVEVDPRLGGDEFEAAARLRSAPRGGAAWCAGLRAEAEIVVVPAAPILDPPGPFVAWHLLDAAADRTGRGK